MNEQENKAKSVPLLIYENEMKHKKHIIVGLFTILGLTILVLGVAIYMFMSFIGSFDRVSYDQDGKGINNVNTGKQGDGERFAYGTDGTYKQSLGASQITTNAYATFEALDTAGKANFYVAKDILITPKQDFKTRIMYIDKNYISEFKIEEI